MGEKGYSTPQGGVKRKAEPCLALGWCTQLISTVTSLLAPSPFA